MLYLLKEEDGESGVFCFVFLKREYSGAQVMEDMRTGIVLSSLECNKTYNYFSRMHLIPQVILSIYTAFEKLRVLNVSNAYSYPIRRVNIVRIIEAVYVEMQMEV